eukprot:1054740-Pleurochrysis_carterae.AAC.3
MIAFTRACTLVDLLISRRMRWLASKATQLDEWSPYKMGLVFDLLEDAMTDTARDGAYLFDPSLKNVFQSIADMQPLFKIYIDQEMREEMVRSPEGTRRFSKYEAVLSDTQMPSDPSNIAATEATVEVLEVMAAAAAINKMHDPKISVADKLASQEGANAHY